jgi:hypothetical protein
VATTHRRNKEQLSDVANPDAGWGGRRAKLHRQEKLWIAKYCMEHDFLVRKGSNPADPRDTVASILVNQGSTPNVAVQQALAWIKAHWSSGPFDITWYTTGGLVNATLHDFRGGNPVLGIAAQAFLFPGRVNTDLQAVSGPEAEKFVEQLDVDFTYAFLSVYALDLDSGRTRFQYSEEVRLQEACARLYADHKFLFLDSSKFKREGKSGYGLDLLLDQAKAVTIYTPSTDSDQDITDRFIRLCETLVPKTDPTGSLDKSRMRTLRLRIVSGNAKSAKTVDYTGFLKPVATPKRP